MTYGLGGNGDAITSEDRFVELDRGLGLILVRMMCKKHCNVFDEHIYYIMSDFHKPFMMESLIIMNKCMRCLKGPS